MTNRLQVLFKHLLLNSVYGYSDKIFHIISKRVLCECVLPPDQVSIMFIFCTIIYSFTQYGSGICQQLTIYESERLLVKSLLHNEHNFQIQRRNMITVRSPVPTVCTLILVKSQATNVVLRADVQRDMKGTELKPLMKEALVVTSVSVYV